MWMQFDYSEGKNQLLIERRGVSFTMVIASIAKNGILLNFEHPNQAEYTNQKVLVVEIESYAYCVPYVVDGDTWFLKTIYPSRKFKHLIKGGTEDG